MSDGRTFSDVTVDALSRIKELGPAEYGVIFDLSDAPRSNATSQTPFGECVIAFVHDIARAELTLTIVKKPWLIPASLLWSGFLETLGRCCEQR
jgi:hypothetical protein